MSSVVGFIENGVNPTVLPVPGYQLDYVENTSAVTISATVETSPTLIVSGSTIALDGSTDVIVECYCRGMQPFNGTNAFIVTNLWDGSTDLGRISVAQDPTNVGSVVTSGAWRRVLRGSNRPSSGSHTYKWQGWQSGGNGTIQSGAGGAGTGMPIYIRVTRA